MIDIYTDNPIIETVNRLSVLLNKPKKSIISKLSKEGVYITIGYRDKRGAMPVTKIAIVREIEDALDTKLPDLDKAPKTTLKALAQSVTEMAILLEDSLEVDNIREEMRILQK